MIPTMKLQLYVIQALLINKGDIIFIHDTAELIHAKLTLGHMFQNFPL